MKRAQFVHAYYCPARNTGDGKAAPPCHSIATASPSPCQQGGSCSGGQPQNPTPVHGHRGGSCSWSACTNIMGQHPIGGWSGPGCCSPRFHWKKQPVHDLHELECTAGGQDLHQGDMFKLKTGQEHSAWRRHPHQFAHRSALNTC
jgi:hypothetical protein